MACDEMSSITVKIFISLLTTESLMWTHIPSHRNENIQRLQIIIIDIIILFGFSGFLWFGGFCISLRGNYFHCVGYIDLQLNIGEKNEKINQEELTVVCHLFLCFCNSKCQVQNFTQSTEEGKTVRVLDLKGAKQQTLNQTQHDNLSVFLSSKVIILAGLDHV